MIEGLQHAHSGTAYMVFVACLVNLALALSVSKKPATLAHIMYWTHQVVLWGGRSNFVIGCGFWYVAAFYAKAVTSQWLVILSVVLWSGVELTAKRLVTPDLQFVLAGAPPGKKLLLGVGLQLLIVIIVFAMMSLKSTPQ